MYRSQRQPAGVSEWTQFNYAQSDTRLAQLEGDLDSNHSTHVDKTKNTGKYTTHYNSKYLINN